MADLEVNQESRNPLKSKRSCTVPEIKTFRDPSPPEKRGNPAEGRSLGTFNGQTDLDFFLVRFETCSKDFGWSKSEKVFHLMNTLTDSAEPIVKEVGSDGTLEFILELLQSRFGNKLRVEKFPTVLRNRKRGCNESLQELFLNLCRLWFLASGEGSEEKFPEKYFRNIFVDALNDREFRRSVLVQNPGTMEEAYRVATQLEAIDVYYNTPVADSSHVKPRVRQLDREDEYSQSSNQSTEPNVEMARRLEELKNEVQNLRADAQRQASYFPNKSSYRPVQPSVQDPRSMTSGSTRDESTANTTHAVNVPMGSGMTGVQETSRNCYYCGEIGHFSRDCRKPKYFESTTGRGTQVPRTEICSVGTMGPVPGISSGTISGLNSPARIRQEAYLEVKLGTRQILALLDSGCEQSVIGRNLIKKVPLEPTSEKLSTADGTDIPLLGETTITFAVADCSTNCRVVVTDATTELILGIEWLQRNQCVWNFGSNSFVIKRTHGRLRCRRTKRTVRRILLSDDVVIPGMHTTNVTVLVTRT